MAAPELLLERWAGLGDQQRDQKPANTLQCISDLGSTGGLTANAAQDSDLLTLMFGVDQSNECECVDKALVQSIGEIRTLYGARAAPRTFGNEKTKSPESGTAT